MSNELYNTIARVTDGIYEGIRVFVMMWITLFRKYYHFFSTIFRKYFGSSMSSLCLEIFSGIAIGGDVFPGSTLSDHVLRFNNIPQVVHLSWDIYIFPCSIFKNYFFNMEKKSDDDQLNQINRELYNFLFRLYIERYIWGLLLLHLKCD